MLMSGLPIHLETYQYDIGPGRSSTEMDLFAAR